MDSDAGCANINECEIGDLNAERTPTVKTPRVATFVHVLKDSEKKVMIV